jgi:membrane protein
VGRLIDGIKRRLENLRSSPGEEMGRWARFVRYQAQLWRFCARRLREHNAMAMSAALSFRTIFALVPTLVLAVLILKSVGTIDASALLRRSLEASGLSEVALKAEGQGQPAPEPAASQPDPAPGAPGDPPSDGAAPPAGGPTTTTAPTDASPAGSEERVVGVLRRIERLVQYVEQKLTLGALGPIGFALLIWSALALVTTIERSLNRIFQAPRSRSLGRRILLYWAAVTFVPIVLATVEYAAGQVTDAARAVPGVSWLVATLGWLGPVLASISMLAAVYVLMPNTRVRWRSAFGAAAVAVLMWLLAKWGFTTYVTQIIRQRSLYGALGLIPLFLIWINLCWLVFLFGAELAHTAANLERFRSAEAAERIVVGPWDLLAAALAVAEPYVAGKGPAGKDAVVERLGLPEQPVEQLLSRLARAGVLCEVAGGDGRAESLDGEGAAAKAYVPARPVEAISVREVLDTGFAGREMAPGSRYSGEIGRCIGSVRERADAALESMTLADLTACTRKHERA